MFSTLNHPYSHLIPASADREAFQWGGGSSANHKAFLPGTIEFLTRYHCISYQVSLYLLLGTIVFLTRYNCISHQVSLYFLLDTIVFLARYHLISYQVSLFFLLVINAFLARYHCTSHSYYHCISYQVSFLLVIIVFLDQLSLYYCITVFLVSYFCIICHQLHNKYNLFFSHLQSNGESMIDKNGNVWTCIVCGKIAADAKTKVRYFPDFLNLCFS